MARTGEPTFLIQIISGVQIRAPWMDMQSREGDGPWKSSPGDAMNWLEAKLFVLARMSDHPCQILGHELCECEGGVP